MKQPNLITIRIEEPTSNPTQPSIHHTLADDLDEAEKRYRALVAVMISQLTGLSQTHIRFIVSPADPDAVAAVSFWLLPLFRGDVIKHGDHFHFTPEQHAPEFSIEFSGDDNFTNDEFEKCAELSVHCPECGARWINAAMQQCSEKNTVIGRDYLFIKHQKLTSTNSTNKLPDLALIHTDADWQKAIDSHSPIGLKLKKFHAEISGD